MRTIIPITITNRQLTFLFIKIHPRMNYLHISFVLSVSDDSFQQFLFTYISKAGYLFEIKRCFLIQFKIMSKNVLIIQHSTTVRPAHLTTFFSEHNIPFEILPIFNPDYQSKLPENDTSDYSAIVSLGGPQGTYEDDKYSYLKWEKSFLAAQLALNTPILGICLGAQLLADVIGGHGYIGKYGYEVGYVQYELTSEGKEDPIISKMFEEQQNKPLFLMHHRDSFDLPSNVSVFTYTSNNYTAAYRIGSAFCVQFHPEASFTELNEWVQRTRKAAPELYGNLDIDEILQQAQACEIQADKSRRLFFETWWNSLPK
jgi:GMP synthase-like glutamine amidotransferase